MVIADCQEVNDEDAIHSRQVKRKICDSSLRGLFPKQSRSLVSWIASSFLLAMTRTNYLNLTAMDAIFAEPERHIILR